MSISVLEAAASLRGVLRGFDAHLLSVADAGRVAEELTSTAKACTAAAALAAARAEQQPASFARQSGITPGQARQALDAARSMDGLPDTRDALLGGEISIFQAAEIAQTPGGEQDLLPVARSSDLARTKEQARRHRQARTDPADLRARQFAARTFRHWTDGDGLICGRFALPPELGLPLVRRAETAAIRARRAAKAAGRAKESFDAYRADGLAALATDTKAGASQLQADLIIVCDLNAFLRGHAHDGEVCHIIGGGPIPVEVAHELSKNAFLKAALHDGINLHTISHFGRRYPAHLRTALNLGNPPDFAGRVCAECGQRYGLQTDHIDPVANQGPTTLANLQLLCWDCHETKTELDRQAGLLGPKAKSQTKSQTKGRPGARPPN